MPNFESVTTIMILPVDAPAVKPQVIMYRNVGEIPNVFKDRTQLTGQLWPQGNRSNS